MRSIAAAWAAPGVPSRRPVRSRAAKRAAPGALFATIALFTRYERELHLRQFQPGCRWEHGFRLPRPQLLPGAGSGSRMALGRGRGMKRCLLRARDGFEVLVGAAVLANNRLIIAKVLGCG